MNISEAVNRACKEPTLLKALSFICLWESERVVHQARFSYGSGTDGRGWDTCFEYCLKLVLEEYKRNKWWYKIIYKIILFLKGGLNGRYKSN